MLASTVDIDGSFTARRSASLAVAQATARSLRARAHEARQRARLLVASATRTRSMAERVASACVIRFLSATERGSARIRRRARPRRAATAAGEKNAPGVRTIVDASSREWRVQEEDASMVPGARGPRSLVFENHAVVRRLWRYPADWRSLPDDTLLLLLAARPG
jgi:hypothetical protein